MKKNKQITSEQVVDFIYDRIKEAGEDGLYFCSWIYLFEAIVTKIEDYKEQNGNKISRLILK